MTDVTTNNKTILDYWPMSNFAPRKSQKTALNWVEKLPANVKYILVEMPVGCGKSPFGLNVSGWLAQSLGDSYILTPQKILQKQYEDSFDKKRLGTLYGKANYDCVNKKTNCDIGGDIKPQCDICPARIARDVALRAPNTVLNYTLALLLFKYSDPRTIRRKRVIIFDECQNLESHLVEFNAVNISDLRCKKLGVNYLIPKTIEKAMAWIVGDYTPMLHKKIKELGLIVGELEDELEFNARALTAEEQQNCRTLKELTTHAESIDNLCRLSIEEIKEEFVLVQEKNSFKFKELYGKNVFHSLVKPMADKFIFMSSTILNKDAFCRDLGLNPDEAAFLSLDSEFPVDNRPVVFKPIMKMNYQWNDDENYENRKKMALEIKELCELHKDESGIIHTGNFQISEWLVNELRNVVPHEIYEHNPSSKVNRGEVIDSYMQMASERPCLLISPSITEGLDLKDDLGRFAIFLKVPFPNMMDNWIKRRMELSREWYNRQAIIAIIQGGGRIVRTPTDHGNVYILDSSFGYLHNQVYKWLPDWWKEAFIKV